MTLQIDSGNVVTVFHENRFYLAYVQDIRNDDALVDFHCETLAPTWISSHQVWPQMFRYLFLDLKSGKEMQVAVRDERNGPLRFRPGRLMSDPVDALTFKSVLYVEWVNSSGISRQTVVRLTQIMAGDPHPEQSLFCLLRNDAVKPFSKLVLPLSVPCSSLVIKSSNLFQLRQLIKELLFMKAERSELRYQWFYNHFHAKLINDSIFLVFWERSAVISHNLWTDDDLADVVTKWITTLTHANNSGSGEERHDDTLFQFMHLPDLILNQILMDLEIHDLINSRRVCRRWKSILADVCQLAQIKIDLHKRRQMFLLEEYVWDFGRLLEKLLHGRVKALTIINANRTPSWNSAALCPVVSVAALKGIRFKAVQLINGQSSSGISVDKWGKLAGSWRELMPVTDLLIIRNSVWKRLMFPHDTINDSLILQLQGRSHTQRLLQALAITIERRILPGLHIPYIRLDFRLPESDNFHTLLNCMERCCPDISVKDKSTALAVYRYLISAQLPQGLLATKEIVKKWKSFDPVGRFDDMYEAETSSLEIASLTKVFTYAVLCLFEIMQ